MAELVIHLRDMSQPVCDAWTEAFSDCAVVTVACEDIFSSRADAIVSPANSFGFMDGGIDLVYMRRFGWGLQSRLQTMIAEEWAGELPVGHAVVVPTDDPDIPWMISAPTMRVPEDVRGTVNAYLAFRAVLLAIETHNSHTDRPIRSVLCPGLATLTGRMPPGVCAKQMRSAMRSSQWVGVPSVGEILQQHEWMKSPD